MKKSYILTVLLIFCFAVGLFISSDIKLYSQLSLDDEDAGNVTSESENPAVEGENKEAKAQPAGNEEKLAEVIGLIEGKDKKKYAAPDWTLSVFAKNGDPNIPVAKIEVKVDNSDFVEYSGPAQLLDYPKDSPKGKLTAGGFTIEKEGVHYIQARATDILGNVGPLTKVELFIDATPPDVDYEIFNYFQDQKKAPYRNDAGIFVSGKHEIYFYAFDMRSGVNMDKYQYSMNGGEFKKYCDGKTDADCVDKFIVIPDSDKKEKQGWKIFTVKAADRVGNESSESAVTVYLDNETPKPAVKPLFMEYEKDGKKFTSIDNQFSVVHEDLGSGTKLVEIKIDNDANKWDPYKRPIRFSTSGEHKIFMKATDNVGNVETNEYVVNIVIDPPNAQIVQPDKQKAKGEGNGEAEAGKEENKETKEGEAPATEEKKEEGGDDLSF